MCRRMSAECRWRIRYSASPVALVALALLLFVGVGATVGPVPSAAASSNGPSWSFTIPGSHGYEVSVSAAPGYLTVFVDGRSSDVEYLVRTRDRSQGMLEGDIGEFGKIAMRFVPSESPRRSDEPNGCHGHRPVVQKGHFVGRFWFRGEDGYTSVSVRRAVGYYEHGFRGLCQGPVGEPLRPNLTARAATRSRSISVAVYFREYEVSTDAEVVEHVEGIRIWRFVGLAGPLSASSFEPDGSIFISPPSPFSGSAEYTPGSSGGSWVGNLSADFPGIGPLGLAGPRFKVSARGLPSTS
jgi:hypothetical protein